VGGAPDEDTDHGIGDPPRHDSAWRRLRTRGARTSRVTDAARYRMLGWELLIVLAVFPFPSILAAVYEAALHLDVGYAVNRSYYLPHEPVATLILLVAARTAMFAGAGLVLYLLAQSGEGIEAIGLGGQRLRLDLALVLPVWFGVFVAPMVVGSALEHALHLHTYAVLHPGVPAALLFDFYKSINAGIVEEIVVLGYLVRRLEQRGWSSGAVVAIATFVRVAYHVYYGPGVIVIACWALAAVLLYRRIRRLTPFIVCHGAWDMFAALHHRAATIGGLGFVAFSGVAVVWFVRWRSWSRPSLGAPFTPSPNGA